MFHHILLNQLKAEVNNEPDDILIGATDVVPG
jgi:hypothetical protein